MNTVPNTSEAPLPLPTPTVPEPDFARGFDASYVQRVEANGGAYRAADGTVLDIFELLAANGVTHIRLRVWNNPPDGHCNPAEVLALAARAQAAGLKVLIDFHYSDGWADPGQQTKPAAWQGLSVAELNQAIYDFTYEVVKSLVEQGTPPDMVAIGNEIVHGMLWPEGYVDMSTPRNAAQWNQFGGFVRAGVAGARAAHPEARVMIHIASAENAEMRWFFDGLAEQQVDFDLIGLSYYPKWHGPLERMRANLADMAIRYRKPVMVVETSYPFTLDWKDKTGNVIGLPEQLAEGYPASPEGQAAFLQAVFEMTRSVPDGLGAGVFYWGGEWIATHAQDDYEAGSPWENQALFDFEGRALPALAVFRQP